MLLVVLFVEVVLMLLQLLLLDVDALLCKWGCC
jgi:hypothetical protein